MLFKIGSISHEKGKNISAPANTVRIADAATDLEYGLPGISSRKSSGSCVSAFMEEL